MAEITIPLWYTFFSTWIMIMLFSLIAFNIRQHIFAILAGQVIGIVLSIFILPELLGAFGG